MSHYHFDAIVDENRVSSTNPGMPVIDPQNMKFVQLKNAINKLTRIVDEEPFPQIIRMPDGTAIRWYFCESDNCHLYMKPSRDSKKKQEILIQNRNDEEAIIWCDGYVGDAINDVEGVIAVAKFDDGPRYFVQFDARYDRDAVCDEIKAAILKAQSTEN